MTMNLNLNKAVRIALFLFMLNAAPAWSESKDKNAAYAEALQNFRDQPATDPFFSTAVGYAVFPTVGKGGIGIGGAFGIGRAYKHGIYVGDVKMGQVSIGWQFGGQAYSEIIFFPMKFLMNLPTGISSLAPMPVRWH